MTNPEVLDNLGTRRDRRGDVCETVVPLSVVVCEGDQKVLGLYDDGSVLICFDDGTLRRVLDALADAKSYVEGLLSKQVATG